MNGCGAHHNDRSGCPDREELVAFNLGKLDEEALRRVGGHLEVCRRCENTLLDLDDDNDKMVRRLRDINSVRAYRDDTGYREFVQRINSVKLCAAAAVPSVEKLPEQLGPYRILGLLGEGGMGAVYKAKHVHLGREIALKILPRDRSHDDRYVKRFYAEMEAIGKLDHPHVVRALDAGVVDRFHFLAMEYVAGTDLSRIVSGKRQLGVADACEIVRQAALGLAYIHEHGFVHRDVKPSNLMLTEAGQVKILDLGLALLRHRETVTSMATSSDQILGTADYMAPEQGLGKGSLDRRADLYSLGCVLYRLLTGRVLFGGGRYNTTLKKLAAHATDPPPPLHQYRNGLSADIERLLKRLLAKNPRERFDTAAEVADHLARHARGTALDDLVCHEPPDASTADNLTGTISPERSTDGTAGRLHGTKRRFQAGLLVASLLIVLIATGGGIGYLLLPSLRPGDADQRVLPTDEDLRAEREPGATQPREPCFELLKPDELRRDFQYSLLNVEPSYVYWPQSPLSTQHLSPEIRQLSVYCNALGLLSLGSVPPVEGYILKVDIFQSQWAGGVGVFFGYQPLVDGEGPAWRFHRLELQPNRGQNRAEFPFMMKRSLVSYHDRPGGIHIREVALGATPVEAMSKAPQVLDIEVHGGQLIRVRWAGADLHELCIAEANADFTRQDYFGQFGLYFYRSDAVFRNASIVVF